MSLNRTNPTVVVSSSALPTGAATSANQATEVASLGSIDTKLTSQATAANQTAEATLIGAVAETAPANDTASSGLNGRLQRIAQRLTSLIALLPTALGAGGGLKVDGSGTALPVSAASLPLPTGASTETTLGTRLSETDFDTKTGSLTETAPSNDTNSSGLNGRLQRIAQRLTSLIALLPTALGSGGGLKVDGSGTALPISVATLPARSATVDSITAKAATDAIMNGLTALTPKFAVISAAGSGTNAIVAAVTSKKIRVLAYNFMANGTVNAKFQTGSGGDLTGLKYLLANTGLVAPFNPVGWFETIAGEALNLNLSAAIPVGGELVYIEV